VTPANWSELLWPRPVRRRAWRRNVAAVFRVRAGRFRFAWAVPLFVVEDLLEGLGFYAMWLGPLPRRLSGATLPAWRQVRWCGPVSLVDIRTRDVLVQLRLV